MSAAGRTGTEADRVALELISEALTHSCRLPQRCGSGTERQVENGRGGKDVGSRPAHTGVQDKLKIKNSNELQRRPLLQACRMCVFLGSRQEKLGNEKHRC